MPSSQKTVAATAAIPTVIIMQMGTQTTRNTINTNSSSNNNNGITEELFAVVMELMEMDKIEEDARIRILSTNYQWSIAIQP